MVLSGDRGDFFLLSEKRRRWLLVGAALIGGTVLGAAVYGLMTWNQIDRVVIDRLPVASPADEEPETDPSPDITAVPEFRLPPIPSATDGIDTFLLIGSDSRDTLDDLDGFGDFEGARADVILLIIRPREEGNAAVVSLPRDLWVSTPCGQARINDILAGCEGINGETTLLVTVESLTGLGFDHFGMVDLAGFQEVVDELGGYEICLDAPVRDAKANLALPAGCNDADGADTLAWMRSRTTEVQDEDGTWFLLPGVSDLTRNERQREFMVEMIGRIGDFSSPQDAVSSARTIAPYLTIDTELGITQAVSLAWDMRGLGSSIEQVSIPVDDYMTQAGAEVLVPVGDVESIIAKIIAVETVGESGATSDAS